MSPPIAGAISVPSSTISWIMSSTADACGVVAGLMQTRPTTFGSSKPDQSVSAPPMLRPTTTISSTRFGKSAVRCAHLAGPVGPPGGDHLLDRRTVAGESRHLDVMAERHHRLGDPAHRRRVAGEAVEDEHADVGGALVRQRLGFGQDG